MLFVKYYNNVGALGRGMSALILACFFCSLVIALQMFDTLNSRIINPTEWKICQPISQVGRFIKLKNSYPITNCFQRTD